MLAALPMSVKAVDCVTGATKPVEKADKTAYVTNRPAEKERLFISDAV